MQEDWFFRVVLGSNNGPLRESGISEVVYNFNGRNDISNNWLVIDDDVKNRTLQMTDDFTVSMWIRVDTDSGASYIFSFEIGNNRYFSLYERSQSRANLYYFRDSIPGEPIDDGVNTQVAFSFYYDTNIFPLGLRDGQWHFVALTIDFPEVMLIIDGYVIRPTQGNYFDSFDNQVIQSRLTDGSHYQMIAPLLTKTQQQIDDLAGRIGGSSRGDSFSLDGQIRQMMFTNLVDTNTYNCLGSCNSLIVADGTVTGFTTFYDPAKREYQFSGNFSPLLYTNFLQTVFYSSNGFLPPEEVGESRLIRIQVGHTPSACCHNCFCILPTTLYAIYSSHCPLI